MGTQESQISKNWALHFSWNFKPIYCIDIESSALKLSIWHLDLICALFRHFWAPLRTPSVIKKNQKLIFTSILFHTSPILPKKTKNKPILNYVTLPLSTLTTVQCDIIDCEIMIQMRYLRALLSCTDNPKTILYLVLIVHLISEQSWYLWAKLRISKDFCWRSLSSQSLSL
jgi:hypothetical protein